MPADALHILRATNIKIIRKYIVVLDEKVIINLYINITSKNILI